MKGRTFPVEVVYLERLQCETADLNVKILRAVEFLEDYVPGDILVFLPGEFEIREAKERLVEVWPSVNSCDENFGSGNKDYFLKNKLTNYYLFSKVNYHINNQILINLFFDSNLDADLNITLKF